MHSWKLRAGIAATASMLTLAAPFAATAASAHPSAPPLRHGGSGAAHALFVQTNQPAANTVVVYRRASDGSLTEVAEYQTGGKGGVAVGAAAGLLASQGSLVLDQAHGLLYAVNAGSDSVTVFGVRGDQLRAASRRPVPRRGDGDGDDVYVLNGGGDGSVSGFRVHRGGLAPIPGSTRTLGLGGSNPPAFLASPAQVGFSPDGHHLVVTTKTHNTIDVFDVTRDGRLSTGFVAYLRQPGAVLVHLEPRAARHDRGRLVERDGLPDPARRHPAGPRRSAHRRTGGAVLDCGRRDTSSARMQGRRPSPPTGSTGPEPSRSPAARRTVSAAFSTDAPPVDLAVTHGQRFLYVQEPTAGEIQGYAVHADGTLTLVTTVTGLPTTSPMKASSRPDHPPRSRRSQGFSGSTGPARPRRGSPTVEPVPPTTSGVPAVRHLVRAATSRTPANRGATPSTTSPLRPACPGALQPGVPARIRREPVLLPAHPPARTRGDAPAGTEATAVADIYMPVGLTSVGSFTSSFRRAYGMTPTQYRASSRRRRAWRRSPCAC